MELLLVQEIVLSCSRWKFNSTWRHFVDDSFFKLLDIPHVDVSENSGTPKSSILIIGFSIINHPFWDTPIFGNTYVGIWNLAWILRVYLRGAAAKQSGFAGASWATPGRTVPETVDDVSNVPWGTGERWISINHLPFGSLTVRPWKWMVGRWVSFWDSLFSGAMLTFGGGTWTNKSPLVPKLWFVFWPFRMDIKQTIMIQSLGGGNSKMCLFSSRKLKNGQIWRSYFSDGWLNHQLELIIYPREHTKSDHIYQWSGSSQWQWSSST